MKIFDAIKQTCQTYYDQLPNDIPRTVCQSAIYSFTISMVFRNLRLGLPENLRQPFAAAGIAALASLVHALTTPLFNSLFGDQNVTYFRETLKYAINGTLVHLLFNSTSYKINLITLQGNFFGIIGINCLKSTIKGFSDFADFLGNPQLANQIRSINRFFSLDIPLGANSTYIVI